jgi:MGT family glycosyltransferase
MNQKRKKMKSLNFLFITLDGGGNLPPVFGLAKLLTDRGHNVRMLSEPSMEEAIRKQGFAFASFHKLFQRTDRAEDIFNDWNAKGIKSPALDNVIFGTAREITDEAIRAINEEPTDILMVDCVVPTAVIAGEAMGIPAVMIQHFPEYLPGPNRPPGIMGLLPGKGIPGRFRDRLLAKIFNGFTNKYKKLINEVRTSHKLPPINNVTDIFFNSDLRLVTTLESFDFPIEPLPENFYYTGPILGDPDWVEPWSNPWKEEDERPLVIISLSTTYQNQAPTIQAAIDALKDLDVRGLATLGPAIEEETFDVPENVVVVKSAPHSQIFPMADLVVTHAGHGTIMRSLQHGSPLICLPMGRDQDDSAVKIKYHGCGLILKPGSSSVKIKKAIQKILRDSRYKENVRNFQKELADKPSHSGMIDKIEDLYKPQYDKKVKIANTSDTNVLHEYDS